MWSSWNLEEKCRQEEGNCSDSLPPPWPLSSSWTLLTSECVCVFSYFYSVVYTQCQFGVSHVFSVFCFCVFHPIFLSCSCHYRSADSESDCFYTLSHSNFIHESVFLLLQDKQETASSDRQTEPHSESKISNWDLCLCRFSVIRVMVVVEGNWKLKKPKKKSS